MIPKIIHYCWFGPNKYSRMVNDCITTWKKCLPDYEFKKWNEENSPLEIPFIQEAYRNKKWAFVSDYIRLWAIYNYGGIYLDTDMYVLKSFDDLLNNISFFGYEEPNQIYISAGIIGCEKNNKFIGSIIDSYKTMTFSIQDIQNIKIPSVITKNYKDYVYKEQITIYPFDFFYPFPYSKKEEIDSFLKYKTTNTYAIHLWNASWKSIFQKIIEKTKKNIKAFINMNN